MVLTENEITMAQPVEGVNGQNSVIIRLRRRENAGYSFPVIPQWITGICSPCNLLAIQTPKASFFCIVALAHIHSAALIRVESMVAQAGHPEGWPVSSRAGTANPVWATTNQEICSSGGSKLCYLLEIDTCQRPLPNHTHNLTGYFWLYAVLTSRTGRTATKSPPQPMTPPAALWCVITLLLLPVACQLGGFTMFKIIVTVKNHRTRKTTVETCRRRYKTYRGAEKAAQGMRWVCRPDGVTATEEVSAEVVEVRCA